MGKYLVQAKYTAAGAAGLKREGGTRRKEAIESLIAGLGGTVESMYYAFGDIDLFVIFDMPDPAAAAAASMTVNGSGASTMSVTPLLTVEDIDAAAGLTLDYRPPGS